MYYRHGRELTINQEIFNLSQKIWCKILAGGPPGLLGPSGGSKPYDLEQAYLESAIFALKQVLNECHMEQKVRREMA